jgi:hypothetical protein
MLAAWLMALIRSLASSTMLSNSPSSKAATTPS